MQPSDLLVKSFYRIQIYNESLVASSVVAKILAIDDSELVPTYHVKIIDPATNQIYELRTCVSEDFISPIAKAEVLRIIESINQRLTKFIEQ